jgi:hypothetical protein
VTTFTVVWTIDIDADTPEEAARSALEFQRDPMATCTIFDVYASDTLLLKNFDADNKLWKEEYFDTRDDASHQQRLTLFEQ